MNVELPPAVAGFFRAHNTGRTDDFASLFTADAVVHDGNREHRGPAIKAWIDNAVEQYKPQADVVDVTASGDEWTVAAQVSGVFPGSPARLRYHFTLAGAGIAALTIGP